VPNIPPHAVNATDRMVLRYQKQDPRLQAFGFDGLGEHVFGIEHDGQVVSACVSARENELCGEAWVQTAPDHRRQGLAGKVARAWAKSLMDTGKIPFYSHAAGNEPSAGLAKRLGLQFIFEEINLSPIDKIA
jgi:RimJ/RimL family protein N-acetyltransferase